MLAVEKKDFYRLEVRVKTPSVIIDNIECKFNGLRMYSEYENKDILFENKRVFFEKDRTLDGFRVSVFILNESSIPEERIDCLFDEEYEIEDLDLEICNKNGVKYEFSISNEVGEQINGKEVEIEISEDMKSCLNFIVNDNKDLVNNCYMILKNNESFVSLLKKINDIKIL